MTNPGLVILAQVLNELAQEYIAGARPQPHGDLRSLGHAQMEHVCRNRLGDYGAGERVDRREYDAHETVAVDITEPAAADRSRPKEGLHAFLGMPEQAIVDDSRITRQNLYDIHDEAIAVLSA